MTIIANILFVLSAFATLSIAMSSKGWGPEGPVGAPLVTGFIALIQVAALAICIWQGTFDWAPGGRPMAFALLAGYFLVMTALPIIAVGSGLTPSLCRVATVAALVAGIAAINSGAAMQSSMVLRAAVGGTLGLTGLAGVAMVVVSMGAYVQSSIKATEAEQQQHSKWEEEQKAFLLAEFNKLPADAALWQIIPSLSRVNPEVYKAATDRIAARPNLQADMIELLGTGWAEHIVSYLRDDYPLAYAPLAEAYAAFLDKQADKWESTVLHDEYGGKWELNLRPMFEVAAKITKEGGDVRAPLEKWQKLFAQSKALKFMKHDADRALGK